MEIEGEYHKGNVELIKRNKGIDYMNVFERNKERIPLIRTGRVVSSRWFW